MSMSKKLASDGALKSARAIINNNYYVRYITLNEISSDLLTIRW